MGRVLIDSGLLHDLQWKANQWDMLKYDCLPLVIYLIMALIIASMFISILIYLNIEAKRMAKFYADLVEDMHRDAERLERNKHSFFRDGALGLKEILDKISSTEIEDISRINITSESKVELLYYDCPLLFVGRNSTGEYVVISMAEESDDGDFFFAALPEPSDLRDYADEKITLRDLYKKQATIYICKGFWTTMAKGYSVSPESIPDSHMPTEESFLGFDISTIDKPKDKDESC